MKRLFQPELKQPQTPTVLLAQSVDTSVAVGLSLFFAGLITLFFNALLFGPGAAPATGHGSLLVFLSACGLVWSLNFCQRVFFVSFLGATLGQYLTGVRACAPTHQKEFWIGQACECLHLFLPMIWLYEICGRTLGSPYKGLRYMVLATHYEA